MSSGNVAVDGTRDYYADLGLADSSDDRALKDAYRSLAKKYHPDVNDTPLGIKTFNRVKEAYEVLSDPVLRRDYKNERARHLEMVQADRERLSAGFGTTTAQQNERQRAELQHTVAHARQSFEHFREHTPPAGLFEKYRSPQWKKLSLTEKKVRRIQPLTSKSRYVLTILTPALLAVGLFWGVNAMYSHQVRRTRKPENRR